MEAFTNYQKLYIACGAHFTSNSKFIKKLNYFILINVLTFVTEKLIKDLISWHMNQLFILIVWCYFYYDRFMNQPTKQSFMSSLKKLSHTDPRITRIATKYRVVIGLNLIYTIFGNFIYYNYDLIMTFKPFLMENISNGWKMLYYVWFSICFIISHQIVVLMIFEYLLIFNVLTNLKMSLILTNTTPSNAIIFKWRQICALSDEFESIYSMAPFFKITNSFIGAIMFIVNCYIEKEPIDIRIKASLFYFVIHLMIDFYVLHVIDRSNTSLKKSADEMLQKCAFRNDDMLEKFANEVNQSYRFNLTGFKLFALEKSLVIGFGASLISFTVLFIQISTM